MKRCLQERVELLNIPISVSLLYEKEYENMMQCSKKRRSVSEKRTTTTEKNKSIFVDISIRSNACVIH
jgi:hypothetical protein